VCLNKGGVSRARLHFIQRLKIYFNHKNLAI
jgi:hypothetical protein